MTRERQSLRHEFLAEAQELLEGLSRDLLLLDHALDGGRLDPDLVNALFRGAHTLKGVSETFGHAEIAAQSHALEDLLEQARLGRRAVTREVVDVLFEGIERLHRLLTDATERRTGTLVTDRPSNVLEAPVAASSRADTVGYELDDGVLGVLTEYEEHRLRENAARNVPLYRARVVLPLDAIDSALDELKRRTHVLGEIVTYLPTAGAQSTEQLELDVLLASEAAPTALREALGAEGAGLELVPRRERTDRSARAPLLPDSSVDLDAGPATDPSVDAVSLRSLSNTVRVDIAKLDHLMNAVGELALLGHSLRRVTEVLRRNLASRPLAGELGRFQRAFDRHLDALRDGVLEVRMVPLGHVFDRLARIVRQTARDHGKQIRLVVTGAETEVDKLIVEELTDPLMHVIRNAIDHGVELPAERLARGKSAEGTLALNAYQKGSHVLIEIEDDGAGIDVAQILELAQRRQLLEPDRATAWNAENALELIFSPGFSTKEAVSGTSGRGVGLDVARTNIARLGGVVDVTTEPGIGTKFTITLPITLAILRALVVDVGDAAYAIPLASVQEAFLLGRDALRTIDGREVLSLRGQTLPVAWLSDLLGMQREGAAVSKQYVVVVQAGARKIGLVVDRLEGQRDVVIKALGRSLRGVRGFAGATEIGDQRLALVLDAAAWVDDVLGAPSIARSFAEPPR